MMKKSALKSYGWREGRDKLWRHDAFGGSFARTNAERITEQALYMTYDGLRYPTDARWPDATRKLKRYMENPTRFLQPGEYILHPDGSATPKPRCRGTLTPLREFKRRPRTARLELDVPDDGSPAAIMLDPLVTSSRGDAPEPKPDHPVAVVLPDSELWLNGSPTGVIVKRIETKADELPYLPDPYAPTRYGPKSYVLHLELPDV